MNTTAAIIASTNRPSDTKPKMMPLVFSDPIFLDLKPITRASTANGTEARARTPPATGTHASMMAAREVMPSVSDNLAIRSAVSLSPPSRSSLSQVSRHVRRMPNLKRPTLRCRGVSFCDEGPAGRMTTMTEEVRTGRVAADVPVGSEAIRTRHAKIGRFGRRRERTMTDDFRVIRYRAGMKIRPPRRRRHVPVAHGSIIRLARDWTTLHGIPPA